MSKIKVDKKRNLFIYFIIIAVVVIIAGIILGVSQYKKSNELKLSNTNNKLNDIATETGIVDKDEGSFYITLYVTAGVIIIIGVTVFIYVYKKAEE